jgi:hypothetical protein
MNWFIKRDRPDWYKGGIDTFDRIEANCNLEERLALYKRMALTSTTEKKRSRLSWFSKIIDYANFGIKQLKDEEIKTKNKMIWIN